MDSYYLRALGFGAVFYSSLYVTLTAINTDREIPGKWVLRRWEFKGESVGGATLSWVFHYPFKIIPAPV